MLRHLILLLMLCPVAAHYDKCDVFDAPQQGVHHPYGLIADFFPCRQSFRGDRNHELFVPIILATSNAADESNVLLKDAKIPKGSQIELELVLLKDEEYYQYWPPIFLWRAPMSAPKKEEKKSEKTKLANGMTIIQMKEGWHGKANSTLATKLEDPSLEKKNQSDEDTKPRTMRNIFHPKKTRVRAFIAPKGPVTDTEGIVQWCRRNNYPSLHFDMHALTHDGYIFTSYLVCDPHRPTCSHTDLLILSIAPAFVVILCIAFAVLIHRLFLARRNNRAPVAEEAEAIEL